MFTYFKSTLSLLTNRPYVHGHLKCHILRLRVCTSHAFFEFMGGLASKSSERCDGGGGDGGLPVACVRMCVYSAISHFLTRQCVRRREYVVRSTCGDRARVRDT